MNLTLVILHRPFSFVWNALASGLGVGLARALLVALLLVLLTGWR